MKRTLLLIVFIMSTIALFAQKKIEYSANLDGTWDRWTDALHWNVYMHGNVIRFYSKYQNPRDYYFQLTYNGADPTKKEIRQHHKNKEWYYYSGTLEYFVDDDYPSAYSVLQKHGWLATRELHKANRPILKKTVPCTIKFYYDSFYKYTNKWGINVIFRDPTTNQDMAFGVTVNESRLISDNK